MWLAELFADVLFPALRQVLERTKYLLAQLGPEQQRVEANVLALGAACHRATATFGHVWSLKPLEEWLSGVRLAYVQFRQSQRIAWMSDVHAWLSPLMQMVMQLLAFNAEVPRATLEFLAATSSGALNGPPDFDTRLWPVPLPNAAPEQVRLALFWQLGRVGDAAWAAPLLGYRAWTDVLRPDSPASPPFHAVGRT